MVSRRLLTAALAVLLLVGLQNARAEEEARKKISGQIVGTFVEGKEDGSVMAVKVTRVVKGPRNLAGETLRFFAQWSKEGGKWVPNPEQAAAFKSLKRGDKLAIEFYSDEHLRVRRMKLLAHGEGDEGEGGVAGVIEAGKPVVRKRAAEHWKGRARIVGKLRNAPAAELTALKGDEAARDIRVKAGAKGYEIEWLEPGVYALRVEAEGYETLTLRELELRANTDLFIAIEFGKPAGDGGDTAGFFGMVTGEIVEKGEDGFSLKVAKVERIWKGNRAEKPKALEGETVRVVINREHAGPRAERFLEALGKLEAGDKVRTEIKHIEGNRFAVIETLKKID